MTAKAILNVFDHLCNEARNVMHATFGFMEVHSENAADSAAHRCRSACRTSADRLLDIIDDMREVLAQEPRIPGAAEDFDLALSLGETIELLNLAAHGPNRLVLQAPSIRLTIRQNRQAVEQVLTRLLNSALKLAGHDVVRVSTQASDGCGAQIAIVLTNSDLSRRLVHWLNASPEEIRFESTEDVAFGIPLLVAGQRLRALGGSAEFTYEATPMALTLLLPSKAVAADPFSSRVTPPDALSILIAEDCDESFALIELMLRNESLERARTGLEAIDRVKERRFDVVFMDVHMPGLDGYAAIRAIRDWETSTCNARTPIVVLSADAIETQTRCAAQSGCSGFLRKPVRPGDLSDLLSRLRETRALMV
jgi:two-component system, sensor histidine kinase